jgi:hypothetical protein
MTLAVLAAGMAACNLLMRHMARTTLHRPAPPWFPSADRRRPGRTTAAEGEVLFVSPRDRETLALDCLLRPCAFGMPHPYRPVQVMASAPGIFPGQIISEVLDGWLQSGQRVFVEISQIESRPPKVRLRKGEARALLDLEQPLVLEGPSSAAS